MIDYQNAVTLSRSNRPADHKARIRAVVAAGRFAVVQSIVQYCRFTDAAIGTRDGLIADCDTREAADAFARVYGADDDGSDVRTYVDGPSAQTIVEAVDGDDFPF